MTHWAAILAMVALTGCNHPPKVQDDSPDSCIFFCVINHIETKVK